jgi:hypothetical protein
VSLEATEFRANSALQGHSFQTRFARADTALGDARERTAAVGPTCNAACAHDAVRPQQFVTSLRSPMNWRTALTRLWLAVTIPVVVYSAYAHFDAADCHRTSHERVSELYDDLKRFDDPAAVTGFLTREDYQRMFEDAAETRDDCAARASSALVVGLSVPLGLGLLLGGAAWAVLGFRKGKDNQRAAQ